MRLTTDHALIVVADAFIAPNTHFPPPQTTHYHDSLCMLQFHGALRCIVRESCLLMSLPSLRAIPCVMSLPSAT
jgi:hypothetical protein